MMEDIKGINRENSEGDRNKVARVTNYIYQ